MEGRDLLADGLERVQAMLHHVVDGLTLESAPLPAQGGVQLHRVAGVASDPGPGPPPVRSGGGPQAWVSEGWHAVFDMAPDPTNTGGGHTPEEVAAFRPPDGAALLSYHDAVYKRSTALPEHAGPGRPGRRDQRAPVPAPTHGGRAAGQRRQRQHGARGPSCLSARHASRRRLAGGVRRRSRC